MRAILRRVGDNDGGRQSRAGDRVIGATDDRRTVVQPGQRENARDSARQNRLRARLDSPLTPPIRPDITGGESVLHRL